jgi:hypothetical protein
MHLQSLLNPMNTTSARSLTSCPTAFRRATRAEPSPSQGTPEFANTQPLNPPEPAPRQVNASRHVLMLSEVLTTFLVVYLAIFFVTLTVLLLTTELSLALDVVMLVARESLWLTLIAGSVLVLNAQRRRAKQTHGAKPPR